MLRFHFQYLSIIHQNTTCTHYYLVRCSTYKISHRFSKLKDCHNMFAKVNLMYNYFSKNMLKGSIANINLKLYLYKLCNFKSNFSMYSNLNRLLFSNKLHLDLYYSMSYQINIAMADMKDKFLQCFSMLNIQKSHSYSKYLIANINQISKRYKNLQNLCNSHIQLNHTNNKYCYYHSMLNFVQSYSIYCYKDNNLQYIICKFTMLNHKTCNSSHYNLSKQMLCCHNICHLILLKYINHYMNKDRQPYKLSISFFKSQSKFSKQNSRASNFNMSKDLQQFMYKQFMVARKISMFC
ncbi:hypothetical protein TTHERM_000223441 (macronuclear) [Tetrahymena thermophila SB210]|uniref:Uncharacterized protein n=1 Tax=Tetrahymena thermophila (strain SB210) TaxID=312017 RepID=W7XIJ8_TETTS|nr:hypothetical protein TTHERM_000223441 [Tetrahymena thermophila SB210]EWS74711.1 hypothetical protein TTHERM_000223441 [Tetrahymena thermophila SB210]|eukprot:XP_012652712.1 hypothetical protein TTHERM_000223441 [Tetrahymena thermophila SB210]